jgi:hypothetical protein
MSAESSRTERPDPSSASRVQAPGRSRDTGQWTFLTWSFFLSQVLSAEQFLGGAAAASEMNSAGASQQELTGDPASTGSRSATAAGIGNHGDSSGVSPIAVLGSHPNDVPLLNPGAILSPTAGAIGSLGSADAVATTADQPIMLIGSVLGAASTDGGANHDALHHGDGVVGLPIDLGLNGLELGGILTPVVHLVGDVAAILPPVATTLDSVLHVVGGVTDTAGELVGSLTTGLSSATGSLPGVLGSALPQTIGGEVANLTTVIPSTFDLLHDTLAGANGSAPLQGIAGLLGQVGQNPLASGGTLSFPDPPATVHNAIDTLFSPLGGYTDYNLSLQNLGLNAGPASTLPVAGGPLTALLDHLTLDTHSDGANSNAPGFTLPSVLEDLHLRGLGDGITA